MSSSLLWVALFGVATPASEVSSESATALAQGVFGRPRAGVLPAWDVGVGKRGAPSLLAELGPPPVACGRCHSALTEAWWHSRHAQAASNPAFTAALRREAPERRSFCVSCHAPEHGLTRAGRRDVPERGVGCLSCHIARQAGASGGTSQRQLRGAAQDSPKGHEFERTRACADCHQFEFPHAASSLPNSKYRFMQRTWSEHHDNNWQRQDCVDCHMPGGARDHAFPGGYDEALVKSSLRATGRFQSSTDYKLTLTPLNVTHAVPTGDLFRRLRVDVELFAEGRRLERCTRFLARHFRLDSRGRRVEVADDRVHMVPSDIVCSSRLAADVARYQVTYERVAHQRGPDEAQAEVESSFVVTRGITLAQR